MKLYDSRRAPNPRRVRWFMAEKGVGDIEVVDVDLFAGQHKSAEYLERAGIANVPALTLDDGATIQRSPKPTAPPPSGRCSCSIGVWRSPSGWARTA